MEQWNEWRKDENLKMPLRLITDVKKDLGKQGLLSLDEGKLKVLSHSTIED